MNTSPKSDSPYDELLACHIAVYKGRNVDQPCNLTKSVTVE